MNYEDRVTKEYLETALANAGAKVVTGTYTGTGTYGASNPRTLTFSAPPKLVYIYRDYDIMSNCMPMIHGQSYGHSKSLTISAYEKCPLTWSGNSVSWYNTRSADQQLNESGVTYYYFAIL